MSATTKTPALITALEKPGCILLLDEIDKAHPSVVGEVLLNLLDTGSLTAVGRQGREAAHAVIAMTSNLAAANWRSDLRTSRWIIAGRSSESAGRPSSKEGMRT